MISIDRIEGGIIQDQNPTNVDTVLHIAVDGTHSSGITYPIERYLAERQLETPDGYDFGPQLQSRANQKYRLYCVVEHLGGRAVPIVVSSEVARQYDAWHLGEEVLTDGYNELDQAAITLRGFHIVQEAAMYAASYAKVLQPDESERISVILTDRTGLSGFAYAETALPDVNHDFLDLALNADIDGLAQCSGGYINLRQQVEELTALCDQVIVPYHREVRLEDDGKRKLDPIFRNAIATKVIAAYTEVVGADKLLSLSGSKDERQYIFDQQIRRVILRALIGASH